MNAFWWAVVTAGVWGIVPLIEKAGLGRNDPVLGVFARSLGVLFGILVLGLWWSPWKALAALDPRSIFLLALGGFLASVLGQMAFYHALKMGQLSQVTPVAGTYPLVAAVLGWVLLREPLSASRILGALLIVLGLFLLRR